MQKSSVEGLLQPHKSHECMYQGQQSWCNWALCWPINYCNSFPGFFFPLLSFSLSYEAHPQTYSCQLKIKVMKHQGSSRTTAAGAFSAGFPSLMTKTPSATELPASSCPPISNQAASSRLKSMLHLSTAKRRTSAHHLSGQQAAGRDTLLSKDDFWHTDSLKGQ